MSTNFDMFEVVRNAPRPLESRRSPPPWDAICLLLAFFVFVGAVCLGMTWVGGQR